MTTWVTDANENTGSFTYNDKRATGSFTYKGNEAGVSWTTQSGEVAGSFTHSPDGIEGIYFLTDFGFIPYWDTNADSWNTLTYAWGD